MIINNQLLEQDGFIDAEINSFDTLTPEQLIQDEIRTKRQEAVSVSSLVLETSLVDNSHVESLADSMSGDRGQITPMTVRARFNEEGIIVYDIIDGFHRAHALSMLQEKRGEAIGAACVVIYGCSDEELSDLRVLAANSVASVKYARRADWMHTSFLSARWANPRIYELIEAGTLTLSQIFSLAHQKSTGSRLGLTEMEAEEVKEWAVRKAKAWNKPLSTLTKEIRTIEVAAPDLVKRVRKGGGGKGGKGVLTQARLTAVADKLPYDYPLQRKLVDLAIELNLVATQLNELASIISVKKEDHRFSEIEEILTEPEKFLNNKNDSTSDLGDDIEQTTIPKTAAEEIDDAIDVVRLEEVAAAQKAMIEILSGRRRSRHNDPRITEAVLGTLARKLQLLDYGIDGFGEPMMIDPKANIVFDGFEEITHQKLGHSVTLSREEGDIFWLLLQYSGKYIDFRTINFLIGEDIKVAQVVENIRSKLSELSEELSNRIRENERLGYCWI